MISRRCFHVCLVSLMLAAALAGCAGGPKPVQPSVSVNWLNINELARTLGLTVSYPQGSSMVMLSGDSGAVVFNPRMRGILIGESIHFSGHRVAVRGDRVSVPPDFLARCKALLGAPRPQPTPEPLPPAPEPSVQGHVVLDPGHGGRDPGAIAGHGGYEKTVNLAVAHLVAKHLRDAGVRVTMTRTADAFVDLNDRPAVGNRLEADLFVSLHADAIQDRSISGFAAWICHTDYTDASRAGLVQGESNLSFAALQTTLVQNRRRSHRLASLIRTELGRATNASDRGTRLGKMRVLRRSIAPAVLIEMGFLTNPDEAARLFRSDYQNTLAGAISRAILAFLKQGA